MTALQKALELHPDMEQDKIIRFGCPDDWRVGAKPVNCGKWELTLVDNCRKCWNQEYKGETK